MDRDELLCPSEKDLQMSTPPTSPTAPIIELPTLGIELETTQPAAELALIRGNNHAVNAEYKYLIALGPDNTVTTCQHCRATVKTTVKYTSTSRTHILGALWCMLCCCCCIPYCCCNSAKNSDHYCPACMKYIGTYEK